MKTYITRVIKDGEEFIATLESPNKKTALNGLEAYGYKVIKFMEKSRSHICKYCGDIVEGTEEDLLCEACREDFGHAFYSEL